MRKLLLAPSILSADFSVLGEQIRQVDAAGAHWIHIDVMDGAFVPNLTYGAPVMRCVRGCTGLPFDAHLMVERPDRLIPDFAEAGADIITVHAEACTHLHRTLQLIHSLGKKAGVALNPATPPQVLDYILEDVEMVLVMSVNPGFGGQAFIPAAIRKISYIRQMAQERGLDTLIEVDGGVDTKNLASLIEAGADVFVSGSRIFSGDIWDNVQGFLNIMGQYK